MVLTCLKFKRNRYRFKKKANNFFKRSKILAINRKGNKKFNKMMKEKRKKLMIYNNLKMDFSQKKMKDLMKMIGKLNGRRKILK